MLTLEQWTRERMDNSERLMKTKFGKDREGWAEDLAYWRLLLEKVKGDTTVPTVKTYDNYRI